MSSLKNNYHNDNNDTRPCLVMGFILMILIIYTTYCIINDKDDYYNVNYLSHEQMQVLSMNDLY